MPQEPGSLDSSTRLSVSHDDQPVAVGPYKILEKLGEGGCGAVYVAEQTRPVRRRVALKVIKLGMDTKAVVARFEAERQALAMMDHPNIAKVLDAGTTETGRPYFVMELVRGIRITDYCDQHKLGTPERLGLFIDVCHAIQHAHQKGVIHRDIKPSNILVTLHDGVPVPKVIDFGIAKATEGRLTDATVYTQLHQFIGTPAYMSPEQAEMSGLDIDTRSDIYSLGVLLYELLTGTTPFSTRELLDSGLDAMRKTIREKDPVRPSTRLSQSRVGQVQPAGHASSRRLREIQDDLDWIVMKCLEKDRTRRYETANGLAADLKRHLNNEPVVARPPSAAYRLQKALWRNKLAFTAAALVALALITGLTLATLAWRLARSDRDRAIRARAEAEMARSAESAQREQAQAAQARETQLRAVAESQELAARRRAYAGDMNLVQQALVANNLHRARFLLDRHRPKPGEQDLRGWEWRYLWQSCRGDALYKLHQQKARVLFSDFASDGHVVTYDDEGAVTLWDPSTRAQAARLQERVPGFWARPDAGQAFLSADRKWLAAVGAESGGAWVKLWDLAERKLLALFPAGSSVLSAVALSPAKDLLAVYSVTEGVSLWDLAQRREIGRVLITQDPWRWVGAVRFSPDGSLLAIGDGSSRVRVLEARTWRERFSYQASEGFSLISLEFSPDGKTIASSAAFGDATIKIWDVEHNRERATLSGHNGFIASVAFSPDGKTLVSAGADQTIKLWNTSTWKALATMVGHQDEVWSARFAPNGETLVSAGKDGAVFLWAVNRLEANRGKTTLDVKTWNLALAPDGREVVGVQDDGRATVWTVADGLKSPGPEALGTNNVAVQWPVSDEVIVLAANPAAIKVWNRVRNTVTSHPLDANPLGYSFVALGDGRNIFFAERRGESNNLFRRWDIPTRKESFSVAVHQPLLFGRQTVYSSFATTVPMAAFVTGSVSDDASRGGVAVVQLSDGTEYCSVKTHAGGLQGIAIAPDASWLATSSTWGRSMTISSLPSGKEIISLVGHNMVIGRLAAAPNGERLASSSIGHEPIKLWDTASWEETANLSVPGQTLNVIGFAANGSILGAIDDNTRLHLWHAPSWQQIAEAEASANAGTK